jgi:hypothetical protein
VSLSDQKPGRPENAAAFLFWLNLAIYQNFLLLSSGYPRFNSDSADCTGLQGKDSIEHA